MLLDTPAIPIALARTHYKIDLRDVEDKLVKTFHLPREGPLGERAFAPDFVTEMLDYFARGYEFHGTKNRVKYIKPGAPRAALKPVEVNRWVAVFQFCWRTGGTYEEMGGAATYWPWTSPPKEIFVNS